MMDDRMAMVGFALAAAAYAVVAIVLWLGRRRRGDGLAPLAAVLLAAGWGLALTLLHGLDAVSLPAVVAADGLRLAGWLALLLVLLAPLAGAASLRVLRVLAVAVVAGLLALAAALFAGAGMGDRAGGLWLIGGIAGALVVLVLVEQLYRNAGERVRWSLKYLCLGIGAIFAYDLFLFADAWLGQRPDPALWAARGYVNALVAPLLAVAAARNPSWKLDVYVSRGFVLHTATLAIAGGYLVLMAAAAYSIEVYGGAWAGTVQAVFLVGGALGLLILLASGRLRARARVFLSKHFYNYRYDYREEWLRFTRTLAADADEPTPLPARAIRAIAQVVDSPAGVLWQRREQHLVPVAHWNMAEPEAAAEPVDGGFAALLGGEPGWVIVVEEWRQPKATGGGAQPPEWLLQLPQAWLVVPLQHHNELEGFVVLARSRAGRRALNWEDFDLLRIIGRQAASYLAQERAAEALARASQFATFNRLSAFVLHDLKNIIGQLSLLARNARRHGENPAFGVDAIATIEQAVARMDQLMGQLRGGLRTDAAAGAERIDLVATVHAAVAARANADPVPVAETPGHPIWVDADSERLTAILVNLVQNAQEATPGHGRVHVTLSDNGADAETDIEAVIEIEDTGSGMSRDFVRDELFRPFASSKGNSGMGIGAFEARELVRELGGDIEVASVPGAGTRLRLVLPRAAATGAVVGSARVVAS